MNTEKDFITWCNNQEYAQGTINNYLRYMKSATLKSKGKIFDIDKDEFLDFINKINLYDFLTNEKPDAVDYEIMDGIFDYSNDYVKEVQREILKQGVNAYLKFLEGYSYKED